eukprot:TRINITY_DN41699_c0_g1_i1.p1 TRINITY_DN41699_c0_g1~~TRINITY_DN41699_c0_g1_i1.p1  ORF type:complete len:459 (-),score=139.87 TRINITY_DN41699_c0_g1_i1:77-1417(-)
MHGRLKVKTTAQQDAEKQVERNAKLGAYRQAMSAILSRRGEGKKDSKQLMMTSQVLHANPDIHTLWNIRRECVLALAVESPPEKDKLWSKEVELTQQCLMSNPKSYGAWHHRCYSLDQMSCPPWENELALCDRFLSMDERNFHCWDYRQIAAKKAGQTPEKELEFTMERINTNFSNYSAWHYRSKLLPLTNPNPDKSSCQPIEESVHHQELDLVQNAAFTDPDDSSAWLYHTWLVGRGQAKLAILYAKVEKGLLTVATNRAVSSSDITVKIGEEVVPMEWRKGMKWRVEWVAEVPLHQTMKIELNEEEIEIKSSEERTYVLGSGFVDLKFDPEPSEETIKVLKEELENCEQLLEMEPDSKWTNYTKAMLMKALDSNKHFDAILAIYENLKMIDSMRKNYYEDQKSKLVIEKALERSNDLDCLDISAYKLSKIYYKQYLNLFVQVKF